MIEWNKIDDATYIGYPKGFKLLDNYPMVRIEDADLIYNDGNGNPTFEITVYKYGIDFMLKSMDKFEHIDGAKLEAERLLQKFIIFSKIELNKI